MPGRVIGRLTRRLHAGCRQDARVALVVLRETRQTLAETKGYVKVAAPNDPIIAELDERLGEILALRMRLIQRLEA